MNMLGRFLKKLLLLLIPIVLVLGLFVAFEPYDYFYLRGNANYQTRYVSSMRELLYTQPENIIIGDSRMANVDPAYVEELTGEHYVSLAYGGATLQENIEQFWYADAHTDLKKVVFGVSFYRLDDNNTSEKFDVALDMIEHPLNLFTSIDAWYGAAQNIKNTIYNYIVDDLMGHPEQRQWTEDPSRDPTPELRTDVIEGYRGDLYEYALTLETQCNNPKGPRSYLAELQKIIDHCKENGIELTFVITNCHRAVWDLVVLPYGIDVYINYYKNYLKSQCVVYDMEFYNDYARSDANFIDGLHFIREEKLRMTRAIFTGDFTPDYCYRTTPEEYNRLCALQIEIEQNLLPPLIWTPGYAPLTPQQEIERATEIAEEAA